MFKPYAYVIVEYKLSGSSDANSIEGTQKRLNDLGEQGFRIVNVTDASNKYSRSIVWTLERAGDMADGRL